MNVTLTNATHCATPAWPKAPNAITMMVCVANLLVGFPLNCYVIKLCLTEGKWRDGAVIFPLSHSIADIILCATAPISVICYVSYELCFLKPFGFLAGSCLSSRPLFQCCVCVERYLAMVHPATFLRYKPVRYRLRCAAVVWMCTLVFGIIYLFFFPAMPHSIIAMTYTLIFVTNTFCCISILKALLRPRPGEGSTEDTAINAAKKKAFIIVFVNLLTLFVQIIPTAATAGLQDSFKCLFSFDLAISCSLISNIVAGSIQPVLFLHRAGKLRCMRCS